jgi:predicted nucleic acid-binding protein
MTSDRNTFLVDSNVLVYAHDRSQPVKQAIAAGLLRALHQSGRGVLSVQVIGEFFDVSTRKIKSRLTYEEALVASTGFLSAWEILPIHYEIVVEAIRSVKAHQLSYYDALVLATARFNQVPFVLTEDMQDGLSVDGVRLLNPFTASFDLEHVP